MATLESREYLNRTEVKPLGKSDSYNPILTPAARLMKERYGLKNNESQTHTAAGSSKANERSITIERSVDELLSPKQTNMFARRNRSLAKNIFGTSAEAPGLRIESHGWTPNASKNIFAHRPSMGLPTAKNPLKPKVSFDLQ